MSIGARLRAGSVLAAGLRDLVFRFLASWLTGRTIPDLDLGLSRGKARQDARDPASAAQRLLLPDDVLPGLSQGRIQRRLRAESDAHKRVGVSKIRLLRDGVNFLLIILKIVTLYSPLKIFFPIALVSFIDGRGLRRVECARSPEDSDGVGAAHTARRRCLLHWPALGANRLVAGATVNLTPI